MTACEYCGHGRERHDEHDECQALIPGGRRCPCTAFEGDDG